MKNFRIIFAAITALPLALGGCASIISGDLQPISVVTIDETGTGVQGASCMLTNDEGTWYVSTPGSATVGRSGEALTIICTKDGHKTGSLTVESGVKAMAFGNLLFGGIIGGAVDAGTGAAFDYPTSMQVIMGRDIRIEQEETEEG